MNAFLQILTGVTGRFLIVFLAMGGMTGAAVYVGNTVFDDIAKETAPLTETHLPDLARVEELVSLTGVLRDELSAILLVPPKKSAKRLLRKKGKAVAAAVAAANDSIAQLDTATQAELAPMLDATKSALDALIETRVAELSAQLSIEDARKEMSKKGAEVAALLAQLTEEARGQLVEAGRDTVGKVDETLRELVERDVAALEHALTVQSQVNDLSGVALALAQTQDAALIRQLRSKGQAARQGLASLLPDMALQTGAEDQADDHRAALQDLLTIYDRTEQTPSTMTLPQRNELVSTSIRAQEIWDDMIVNAVAGLTTRAEQAGSTNASAIRLLIEWQLVELVELNQMDVALQNFFITGLQGAATPDVTRAQTLRDDLAMQMLDLQLKASDKGGQLTELVDGLMGIADPETGMVSARISFLAARKDVGANSAAATKQVLAISAKATELGRGAMKRISEAAAHLNRNVVSASALMKSIGGASIALFLAALSLTYFIIVRPLRKATDATVRLAQGDVRELIGLSHQRSELGQLTRALTVFRTNLVDKIRMEQEQADAAHARQQADERARRKERAREAAIRNQEAKHQAQERARQEAERKQRDTIRQAAEAERQALTEQQDQVVSILAKSLQLLADGNLLVRIHEPFADRYEDLRTDFNRAVTNLSDMMQSISQTAQSIDNNSGDISDASLDLSKRSEMSAASLGQTSATLTDLTSSVQSAADGASRVDGLVASTRNTAERSGAVVRQAVAAMEEIEESSRQISNITSVIDDISFQTNLLALNAGVEAARAGETGRGFAVVASEVRALAQRSSDAAQQISGLIANSTEQVNRGVDLVDRAGQELNQFISEVEKIADHVSDIACSAKSQSTGISEISSAIAQLDLVTQKNAAMFEETTAACQNLAGDASRLTTAMGRFVMDEAAEDRVWIDVDQQAGDQGSGLQEQGGETNGLGTNWGEIPKDRPAP
ncbi:methyl-accepting chemotaxis protein [Aliiroseovarius crassostreae]|uniref:methyl-accepting chemotaxis protein n=1 Tax=Aliiroseovarius crassostreae TaxID=154981 RepID=UPI003C7DCB0E